jgi:hypothetical protein
MIFEWDQNKNIINYRKHNISFELAKEVFDDINCKYKFDRHINNEDRYHAIGVIRGVIVAVVVHSFTDDSTIRIISARKANKTEVKHYEKR